MGNQARDRIAQDVTLIHHPTPWQCFGASNKNLKLHKSHTTLFKKIKKLFAMFYFIVL